MFASSARVRALVSRVCARTPSRAPRDKWHVCKTTHGAAHWGGERRYHRCRMYLGLDLNIRHRATPLIGIFWELSTSLNYDHLMFLHSARARKRLIDAPPGMEITIFYLPFFPPRTSLLASSLVRSHSAFFHEYLSVDLSALPLPSHLISLDFLPFPPLPSYLSLRRGYVFARIVVNFGR